jgi:hypothetical protein
MEALSMVSTTAALVYLELFISGASLRSLQSLAFCTRHHGSASILLQIFGNSAVWKMQLQVLATEDGQTALDLKEARQKESEQWPLL